MNKNEDEKKQLCNRIAFWLCPIVAIGLFVGGFFMPPQGVIDGSVLQASSVLLGFYTMMQLPAVISSAKTTKITHGDTTIEVDNRKKNLENA